MERAKNKDKDEYRCLVIDASNKFAQRVENIEAAINLNIKKEKKRADRHMTDIQKLIDLQTTKMINNTNEIQKSFKKIKKKTTTNVRKPKIDLGDSSGLEDSKV